jgi:hypothetical protein
MDEGKILIVNLSKGRLGLLNSQLLGMIFVMKFQAAAMSRANVPESERKDFALYVDEFQNFSTDSFATILSEARKYHLNLIVANQFTTQLTDEIRDAVFGNTGTIVAFRVGQDEDAEALSKRMRPAFDASDLLRIPNYNAAVRMLINGVPTQPFSMATLPPLGEPNPKLAQALKQLSAAKYGRPKAQVEKELFERLATKAEPASAAPTRPFGGAPAPGGAAYATNRPPAAFGAAPSENRFGSTSPAAPQPTGPTPTGTGSFLDEWMSKRESKGPLLRQNPWAKGPTEQPASVSAHVPAQAPPEPAQELLTANANDEPKPEISATTKPADAPVEKSSEHLPVITHHEDHAKRENTHPAGKAAHHEAPNEEHKSNTAEARPAPQSEEPKLSEKSQPKAEEKKPGEGEIPLLKSEPKSDAAEGDTIFIDADGTLHMR